MTTDYRIQCLVPDLPSVDEVIPFLREMERSRWYSNFGPICKRFESEMAYFIPSLVEDDEKIVVTLSSATAALQSVLSAIKLRARARILLPALTFPATAIAIVNAGYTPVLSDVDSESWALTPEIARKRIKDGDIDAVVPVAVYGRPVDANAWNDFANDTQLPIVVDAASALGQQMTGRNIHVVFSMHATKPFGVGEGGLLVTYDRTIADKVRSWSNFGFKGACIERIGMNAKLGEYYAAVGLAQMARWTKILQRREKVLNIYLSKLYKLRHVVKLQEGIESFVPSTLLVDTFGRGKKAGEVLNKKGIHVRYWYLPPLYEHDALRKFCDSSKICETYQQIEYLKSSLIGLPFHGFLSKEDIFEIADALKTSLEH